MKPAEVNICIIVQSFLLHEHLQNSRQTPLVWARPIFKLVSFYIPWTFLEKKTEFSKLSWEKQKFLPTESRITDFI